MLLLLGVLLTGCVMNPTTGRRQLALISQQDEIQMGEEAKLQLTEEFGGRVSSPALGGYLTEMGLGMARTTEGNNPELPWEFTLLDSEVINAFALPGGKVFVSRGLVERLDNEAQLAAVVGHEIGHVTARHFVDRHSRELALGTSLSVAGAIVGVAGSNSDIGRYGALALPAVQMGGQVLVLSYNRDQEVEADRLGMRYMTNVGYDPTGARQMMGVLAEASSERSLELLATHPHPETRIEKINQTLKKKYSNFEGTFNEDRFQREVLQRLAAIDTDDRRGVFAYAWCSTCTSPAGIVAD